MTKAQAAPKKKPEKLLEKAELFAYAYIQNRGNATKTAKEVLGVEGDDRAHVAGSEYIRNKKVIEIVQKYMQDQRLAFDEFMKASSERLTFVLQKLSEKLDDPKLEFSEWMMVTERIARLSGFELSHSLDHLEALRIQAAARVSAIPQAPGSVDNSRKTIFMLNPPPIPAGGVPTPAMAQQWQEMGFGPPLAAPAGQGEDARQ